MRGRRRWVLGFVEVAPEVGAVDAIDVVFARGACAQPDLASVIAQCQARAVHGQLASERKEVGQGRAVHCDAQAARGVLDDERAGKFAP